MTEKVLVEQVQPVWNAFCPTGKGGGVDPTCGKKGGKKGAGGGGGASSKGAESKKASKSSSGAGIVTKPVSSVTDFDMEKSPELKQAVMKVRKLQMDMMAVKSPVGSKEWREERAALAMKHSAAVAEAHEVMKKTGIGVSKKGSKASIADDIANRVIADARGDRQKALEEVNKVRSSMSRDNANRWHWDQAAEQLKAPQKGGGVGSIGGKIGYAVDTSGMKPEAEKAALKEYLKRFTKQGDRRRIQKRLKELEGQ